MKIKHYIIVSWIIVYMGKLKCTWKMVYIYISIKLFTVRSIQVTIPASFTCTFKNGMRNTCILLKKLSVTESNILPKAY